MPLACIAISAISISANAGSGYYSSITNTSSGTTLASSLHSLISSNTKAISYSNLYTQAYPTTDVLPGTNVVWDIYSNQIYDLKKDTGSSASSEGSGFNREHTVPQSWFAKATPMVSDIYHIYPTDVYVNNQRSSYMYDDVSSASKTFSNGSKLGTGTIYSSKTTFEIADEYKGDIARGYFYMAIRYSDKIASWSAGEVKNVFSSSYPYLTQNAIKVFTKWAHEDPVSDKEMLRNEATYALQNNRNPFIDHPEWVDTIWSNNYVDSETKTEYSLSDVKSAISSLTSSSSEALVYSTYNKYCRLTVEDKAKVTNDTTLFNYVKAKSGTTMNLDSYWDNVISTYNSTYGGGSTMPPVVEDNNYSLVTSASALKAGDKLILSYKDGSVALSKTQNTSNRGYTSVSISNNTISSPSSSVEVVTLENGSTSGSFRFKASSGSYLTIPSDANKLTSTTSLSNKCDWVISITNGVAKIQNVAYSQRFLEYNTTNKVFAGYKGTQKDISLFKMGGTTQVDLSTYTNQFKNESTKATLNMSYTKNTSSNTSNTTSKTVAKSSFDAISGSLDTNITYQAAKGSASTNPAVYSNIIRVYQNGGTFTVSAKNNAKITSVTLGSSMATKVTYSIDSGTASANQSISANGRLTVNNLSAKNNVLFTCKGTSSSQRLYVNYLSVTYSIGDVTQTVTYTYSNVSMDFKGTISKDLYNALGNASYGVRVKKGTGSYTYYNVTPTLSGSTYTISKNIAVSSSDYQTTYTAEVYVLINGTYYFMNSSSYSIKSLVTYYINNAQALGISSDYLAALKAFK